MAMTGAQVFRLLLGIELRTRRVSFLEALGVWMRVVLDAEAREGTKTLVLSPVVARMVPKGAQ